MRWILGRGMVGSALLVVAGVVNSRVPVGSWVLASPELRELRLVPTHVLLGSGVGLAGLLLLTTAWWSLVRSVTGDPDGVRRTRVAVLAWTVPLLLAPPLFSNDGWSYVATGVLDGRGLSPYVVPPSVLPATILSGVSQVWRSTTSPYGPLSLEWGAMFSHLTLDPWWLLVSYRGLAGIGLLLLVVAVPRLAVRAGRDPARASAMAVASPLVVVHGIGGLHNDLLVAGMVAAALVTTQRGVWWWGAVLAGLAASIKLPGGLAVAGVVVLSLAPTPSVVDRLRRSALVAAGAGATLLAVSLVSRLGFGWVNGLRVSASEPAHLAPPAVLGTWIGRLLAWAGADGRALAVELHVVSATKVLGLAALAVLVVHAMLRRRFPAEGAAVSAAATVMLATTLLSPALHYWYFLWSLPLVACAPLGRRGDRALLLTLAVLGPLAVADPALHLIWVNVTALVTLTLAPLIGWWTGGRAPFGQAPPTAPTGPTTSSPVALGVVPAADLDRRCST